jgi:DNA-binding SARP family transcriptional activator/tetratricopeptide (TPR) repeat protein
MEYRLLGPLEVVENGVVTEFSSSRQRVVLSMLLLESNRVVPLSRLVDAVWDDEPPATARNQIQTCISAIRVRLADPGAAQVIITRSPGYQINVADEDLDIKIFRKLSDRGLEALSHDTGQAVRDMREALALWRGPAASGIESRLVQAIATQLNEHYFRVLDECIDAELKLGRHHQLTAELSALVKQHPLRERTRYQHMLSLYRSGRQAEALDSFHEIRMIFAGQLGLEPGEELRSLQQAILTEDQGLSQADSRKPGWADGTDKVVPHQLPPSIADFTGREHMVGQMMSVLSAERDVVKDWVVPIISLVGKGGVGKTTLALHVAHMVRALYPDGQLFAQLQDSGGRPISASSLQRRFLRTLGMPPEMLPDTAEEQTETYRSLLGERQVLVFLDDAWEVSQVMPLIPGTPGCAVILTSRGPLSGLPGVHQYEVDDLDTQASMELLSKIIGRERVQAEEAGALDLVRLCTGLPLALRIAGAKLQQRRHWSITDMVRRMTDEGRRLDELMLSEIGIRASLALSYNNLSRDAKRLFVRLSLMGAAEFASWVCAPLLDLGHREASDLLDVLVEARLVEVRMAEGGSPRFRLHDLVRIYALERIAADGDIASRARALQRLLECWLSLATEAHRRIYGGHFSVLHKPGPTWTLPVEDINRVLTDDPMGWLRQERAGLVSAVLQAGKVGPADVCWDLAVTSVTLFEKECQIEDWRETHEIALEATRAANNLRGEAAVLYSLGILALRERPERALGYLNRALTIFDQTGDTHGQALVHDMIAFAARIAGSNDEALAHYETALIAAREVGDRVCEVDTLISIAQIRMDREEFEGVEELLDEALIICESITARRSTAQAEHRLAEFLLRTGRHGQAKRWLYSVLDTVRQEGDHLGEGFALLSLGAVHIREADYGLAEKDLAAALELAVSAKGSLLHICALLAQTELWLARSELDSARSVIEEARAVLSRLGGAPVWHARLLALTARVDERAGDLAAAEASRQEALRLIGSVDPLLAHGLQLSSESVQAKRALPAPDN